LDDDDEVECEVEPEGSVSVYPGDRTKTFRYESTDEDDDKEAIGAVDRYIRRATTRIIKWRQGFPHRVAREVATTGRWWALMGPDCGRRPFWGLKEAVFTMAHVQAWTVFSPFFGEGGRFHPQGVHGLIDHAKRVGNPLWVFFEKNVKYEQSDIME
jgi:hypothetical protein